MMTVIVTSFEASGLTVSEKKTETMLLTLNQVLPTSPLVVEASKQLQHRFLTYMRNYYLPKYRKYRHYRKHGTSIYLDRLGCLLYYECIIVLIWYN